MVIMLRVGRYRQTHRADHVTARPYRDRPPTRGQARGICYPVTTYVMMIVLTGISVQTQTSHLTDLSLSNFLPGHDELPLSAYTKQTKMQRLANI